MGTREKVENCITKLIFPLILLLYPFRHVHWGLDLWDTGYNYANFLYMGTDHMDPMWLFSTYLANVVGWLLTRLPFGDTLIGMNIYTGMAVSILALTGYWFCTKKLQISPYLTFLGEVVAVCLCWCPTAVLYNYLTYLFFLGGFICLYLGLKDDRRGMLIAAGMFLGTNVMVRFSNLPEAAMIVAVWAYAIICRRSFRKTMAQTGWCMLGYFGALGVWLLWIAVRYGLDAYVQGIIRLFGMTETATDYTPVSMLLGMVWSYVENLYWVIRLCVIVAAGFVGFAILPGRLVRLKKAGFSLIIALSVLWLYERHFCSVEWNVYDAMLRPGILFLMLALFCGAVEVLRPKAAREHRLLSGMVILVVLLTCLGSNNGVFPSLNNLFVTGPYVFWMIWRFCTGVKDYCRTKGKVTFLLSPFPAQAMALMLLLLMLVQGIGFSTGFVFVEATGADSVEAELENNRVLQGVRMSSERAGWMEELSAYAAEEGLAGREVVLYGYIPAVAFYLQLPPAFNSWPDLDSYSLQAMQEDLEELKNELSAGEEAPVVILEAQYGNALAETFADSAAEASRIDHENEKFQLLLEFMEEYEYHVTFVNEKFVVLMP